MPLIKSLKLMGFETRLLSCESIVSATEVTLSEEYIRACLVDRIAIQLPAAFKADFGPR